MNTYTSLLMLFARSTIFKLLGLLAVMGLSETALFALALTPELDAVFEASHIPLFCFAGSLLWCGVLTAFPLRHSDFLLDRLQLPAQRIFLVHAMYNILCMVVFWGFQACLMIGLCQWFGTRVPENMFGPQSTMLAFYRNDFLHSLLPLADWTRYLRTAALAVLLGTSAAFPLARRFSRGSEVWLILVLLMMLWAFPGDIGSRAADITLVVLSLLAALVMIGASREKPLTDTKEVNENAS